MACLLAFLARQSGAADFNVTTSLDGGAGSLRSAIDASNSAGGLNTIFWREGSGGTLTLADDLASISSGTILDVSGALSAVAIAGSPRELELAGAVTFRNAAADQDWSVSAIISGPGSLTKTGAGKLVLTGANTYAGGAGLNQGVLSVNADAALGDAAGGLAFGGGTLQTAAGIVSARAVSLGEAGGTLDANGQASTFSGVVAGAGALTIADSAGGGRIVLSGANTYAGGTIVDGAAGVTLQAAAADVLGAGGVVLNSGAGHAALDLAGFDQTIGGLTGDANSTVELGAARLTVGGAGDSTFAGVISDGGAGGSLVKTGGGVLTLQAANAYGGGTIVNAGTLSIDNLDELGAGAVTLDGGALRSNAALAFSRDIALGAAGGSIDTGGNDSTFSGVFSGAGLTKLGAGTLTLSGVNTYAGGTTLNAGVLSVVDEGNLGALGGALTFGGGTLRTAAGLADARGVTLNGAGTLDAAGMASTFSGVFAGSGGLTIADSAGGGTIVLSGANTYSGGTTLNGGTLIVDGDGRLGAAGGPLTFNGGVLQTTAGLVSARAVSLNGGGGTLDTLGNDSTFSGSITGAGALTTLGSGTLFLTGSNSYSGGTVLNAGKLNINNSSALGSGALTFNGAGTVLTDAKVALANNVILAANGAFDTLGNDAILSGVISGAGSLTIASTGTLTLKGVNTYSGGTEVDGGAVIVGNASALGSGTLTLDDGILNIDAEQNVSLANALVLGAGNGTIDTGLRNAHLTGVIGGAGSLTKIGGGVLTLSGANTYLGGTVVNGGTLRLGADNALAAAGALTTGPGGTFDLASFSQALASYNGAGTLQLTMRPAVTSLAVAGNAALAGGTLLVKLPPRVVLEGDTFTPITYGSKTGVFSSVASPAAVSFVPTYNANNVVLTAHLVPFADSAVTGNQSAIGRGLEGLRAHPTGDAGTVLGNLYTLDAAELRSALDQIGPASLATMRGIGLSASGAQSAAIAQRTAAIADGSSRRSRVASYAVNRPSPYPGTLIAFASNDLSSLGVDDAPKGGGTGSPWGFFTSGLLSTSRLIEANDAAGTQPGYSLITGGLTAGADYRLDEHAAAGVTAGYVHGHASIFAPASGTVDSESARFGVYGTSFGEGFRASLYLGGAADFYRTRRGIVFGGLSRIAEASPRGTEFNANANASYDFRLPGWGILSPFALLGYDRLMIGRFTETGAGALDLDVGAQTAQSLQSGLGLRISNSFEGESTIFKPYASLGWRREYANQNRPIDAALASGGGSFTVKTGDFAHDGTLVGLGFLVICGKQTTVKLDYLGDFRSHYMSNTGNVVFRYMF